MKNTKNIIINIIWFILGITLIGLGVAGIVDEFWSGMGSSLLIISILQMLRIYRMKNNAEYKEKREIEISDERNKFIRNKAWAWAGYLYVLGSAILVIVFKVIGQEVLSMAAAYSVCAIIFLYYGSYLILNKKY